MEWTGRFAKVPRVTTKPGRKPKSERAPAPVADKPVKAAKPGDDVVLIRGISEDGQAMAVLRARDNRVEAGVVRPVKEGESATGELVKLKPRADFPLLCDVEVELPEGTVNATGGSDCDSRTGPAQVATPSYRANWDAIWSKGRSSKKALLN
jgi:hypothetical protein